MSYQDRKRLKAYRKRIGESKDHADMLMRDAAKLYGHHGAAVLIETVSQMHSIPMNSDYAEELVKEFHGDQKAGEVKQ